MSAGHTQLTAAPRAAMSRSAPTSRSAMSDVGSVRCAQSSHSSMWTSAPQMPVLRLRMTTSPGPGAGTGSLSSANPGPRRFVASARTVRNSVPFGHPTAFEPHAEPPALVYPQPAPRGRGSSRRPWPHPGCKRGRRACARARLKLGDATVMLLDVERRHERRNLSSVLRFPSAMLSASMSPSTPRQDPARTIEEAAA